MLWLTQLSRLLHLLVLDLLLDLLAWRRRLGLLDAGVNLLHLLPLLWLGWLDALKVELGHLNLWLRLLRLDELWLRCLDNLRGGLWGLLLLLLLDDLAEVRLERVAGGLLGAALCGEHLRRWRRRKDRCWRWCCWCLLALYLSLLGHLSERLLLGLLWLE